MAENRMIEKMAAGKNTLERETSENLVEVKGLSKKFCRRLKRSLWYGMRDIASELLGSKKENVKLRKEEFWALKDIDFTIKKGELVGLIGPNGAGKTTLLKALTGLIKPDEGEITIRGKIQALIALGAGFNPILTGRENIYVNGAILGFSKKELDEIMEEIIEFSDIGEFIDMPVQSYSSGMHVRLGFAVAVNLKPDILIVDEVLAVGDASFRRKARNKMMALLHSGISVLFVSHNMALMSSLTSRCIYLQKGKVVTQGPSDDVIAKYMDDSMRAARQKINQTSSLSPYMENAFLTVPDIMEVEDITLFNDNGETEEFSPRDDIMARFKVRFHKKMENVTFSISILDTTDGIIISSTKFTPKIGEFDDSLTLECRIFDSRLREGLYNMGFYALDYKGGALFKSHNAKTFTILTDMKIVENSDALLGFLVIDSKWNVGETTQPALSGETKSETKGETKRKPSLPESADED